MSETSSEVVVKTTADCAVPAGRREDTEEKCKPTTSKTAYNSSTKNILGGDGQAQLVQGVGNKIKVSQNKSRQRKSRNRKKRNKNNRYLEGVDTNAGVQNDININNNNETSLDNGCDVEDACNGRASSPLKDRLRRCANLDCCLLEPNHKVFKCCTLCWENAKKFGNVFLRSYYCSRECMGEDWKYRHCKFHMRIELGWSAEDSEEEEGELETEEENKGVEKILEGAVGGVNESEEENKEVEKNLEGAVGGVNESEEERGRASTRIDDCVEGMKRIRVRNTSVD